MLFQNIEQGGPHNSRSPMLPVISLSGKRPIIRRWPCTCAVSSEGSMVQRWCKCRHSSPRQAVTERQPHSRCCHPSFTRLWDEKQTYEKRSFSSFSHLNSLHLPFPSLSTLSDQNPNINISLLATPLIRSLAIYPSISTFTKNSISRIRMCLRFSFQLEENGIGFFWSRIGIGLSSQVNFRAWFVAGAMDGSAGVGLKDKAHVRASAEEVGASRSAWKPCCHAFRPYLLPSSSQRSSASLRVIVKRPVCI